jgi:nicotinate phosphoribosyltransferase
MAHEYLQACQAFVALPDFQRFALNTWMQEFRGDLGIALSDVVGMDAFLRDFDKLFSKAYDGCRQDSGDPIEWGEKLIRHYKSMGIDPATKSAVFTDALDIPRAIEIARHFDGRLITAFGIGTNLTNDLGFDPLQVVIKMIRCNGRPVAKLSDSPGKLMSRDEVFLDYLRQVFKIA